MKIPVLLKFDSSHMGVWLVVTILLSLALAGVPSLEQPKGRFCHPPCVLCHRIVNSPDSSVSLVASPPPVSTKPVAPK